MSRDYGFSSFYDILKFSFFCYTCSEWIRKKFHSLQLHIYNAESNNTLKMET